MFSKLFDSLRACCSPGAEIDSAGSPLWDRPMSPPVDPVQSDPELPATADAVVIGGGIIGAAAAYYLAKKGHSVALIEKGVIDMKSMVTKTYPIEQTREAIQAVGDRTVLGAVITFA